MASNHKDLEDWELYNENGPQMNIEEEDHDGIKELDNPPPRWIMAVFYLTIGISILYGAYYFWLKVGDQQDAEYAGSVEKAKLKYAQSAPEAPLTLLNDAASLASGKGIYTSMNCATCHGQNGEGNAIGPNLTDNSWLHGCSFEAVVNIITNGFPTKGMTAFRGQLNDTQIQQVSSYVVSLKGSEPANAKAPQGEPCESK